MINAILKGIFSLIISLVNLILLPIDTLINSLLPGLSEVFSLISGFFTWLSSFIPFAVSWTGLNSTIIGIVVAYFTFKLTAPLLIHTIKMAIKWYNALKP